MKLVSVNNYHYRRGGAETVFLDHNAMFTDKGHQVAPFSMQHPSNEETDYEKYFPSEIEYGSDYSFFKKLRSAASVIYSFEASESLGHLLAEFSPDILHAHNIYHHLSTSILREADVRGVPVVLTLHDLKLACPAYTMLRDGQVCEDCRHSRLNVIRHRCIKGSLPLSSIIFAEQLIVRLAGLYRKHVSHYVVPSRFYINKIGEWGIDTKNFSYVPNFVNLPEQSWHNSDDGYYLYMGRLAPEKGLPTLVKAFIELKIPLMIAGDGPLKAQVTELAQEHKNINLLGFLGRDEMQAYQRNARAVIVPSEWYENCPMSVIESYGIGKAIIAADIGGLSEMVAHNDTGLLFEPGDTDSLISTIQHFEEIGPQGRARMGEAARQACSENYSPDSYYRRIMKIYEQVSQ
ncbi:MAG: glycosyltransferase family 4 protein [Pseudomonadota bacterium]